MTRPVRVLFVCTENAARSQMAEALLRELGGERFEVCSAGTHPEERVHPLAVAAMAEVKIDISGQRPKDIADFLAQPFDYIITVCDRAREECPVVPWDTERIHWRFDDPAAVEGNEAERLLAFRRVRDELRTRIRFFTQLQHRRVVGTS